MDQLPSWKDLHTAFLEHSVEHADLSALWVHERENACSEQRDAKGQWVLDGGLPGSQDQFRVTAGWAARRLPNPSNAEPWRLWLDLLKASGYARPLPRRRSSSWHSAKLRAEAGARSLDEPVFRKLHIPEVFKASATFCSVRSHEQDAWNSSKEEREANCVAKDQVSAEIGAPTPETAVRREAGSEAAPPRFLGGNTSQGIEKVGMDDLPELPPKSHNAFEAAKIKAELAYATRTEHFPHNPHLADFLQVPSLIQKVFFEYCRQARNALQDGTWSVGKTSRAIDAAWPVICDFYFVREHPTRSEETKSRFRVSLWRTVTDDPQWKRHLTTFAELVEDAQVAAADPPRPEFASETAPRLEGGAPDSESMQKSGKAELVGGDPKPPQPGRGRPQTITDERKIKAAELKKSGGTNKQAADVIYDTTYPTAQQTKNVSAILRHHQQKSKQSSSPANNRNASLKPRKTKG
jgi:hypothetical protein